MNSSMMSRSSLTLTHLRRKTTEASFRASLTDGVTSWSLKHMEEAPLNCGSTRLCAKQAVSVNTISRLSSWQHIQVSAPFPSLDPFQEAPLDHRQSAQSHF